MSVKNQLTQADKIGLRVALGTLAVAILAAVANWLVVPELRNRFHLDNAKQSQSTGVSAQSQPTPPVVVEAKKVFGTTANTIDEMRRRHQVSRLPEAASGKTLAEMPEHTIAFIRAYALEPHSKPIQQTTIDAYGTDFDFEVHKMSSEAIQIVVAVGAETEERVREGLVSGANLTIYSDPWKDTSKIVSIPLNTWECSRSRLITVFGKNDKKPFFVEAADCRIR